MKKNLSIIVVLILLFLFTTFAYAAYTPTARNQPSKAVFTDLQTHWGREYVGQLYSWGFIKGYPNGKYEPDKKMTAAEFLTVLDNILKDKYPDGPQYPHQKMYIHPRHWASKSAQQTFKYISREDVKLIFGDWVDPNYPIRREQVAAIFQSILSKHVNFRAEAVNINYDDLDDSKFPEAIQFSVSNDLMIGYPSGVFRPNDDLSRAEIAALMVRMLEKT